MKCPTCGAENDPGNRFCDQCGTPLEPTTAAPQVVAASATPAMSCPNCGAPIMPGQAFCDECGVTLTMNTPVASAALGAPTVLAERASTAMTTQEPPATATEPQVGVTCPVCGHQNLPGDRFCDNCGAALTGTPPADMQSTTAPTMMAAPGVGVAVAAPAADDTFGTTVIPPMPEPAAPDLPLGEPPIGEPPVAPPPPVEEPPTPAPLPEDEPLPPIPPMVEPPTGVPPVGEPPAEPISIQTQPPAADAQASYAADQQRLNDEIARQGQIIAQFEQMQAMFGAATPPAVTQGLSDARAARDQAQADLAALAPPAPAADPAEVARLNDELARQGQIIAQFEQMQAMFGAATPPAVTQGLSDARAARDQAQADLAALGVAPAAVAAPAAPAAPPAADDAFSAPTVFAAPPVAESAPKPAGTAPIAPPAPQGARLVLEDGKELALPQSKSEIIIGREDPISGIYPEVDLTSYGGETGGVSRQHAKLNHSNGGWTLTDLNSTNYTRVDGARIEPSVPTPLKDGSKVQFGRVAMTFHV